MCALFAGRAGVAQSFTLSYTSDPGDPIGLGLSATYTEIDGTGSLSMDGDGGVYFEFDHATNPAIDWYVGLAAADDAQLVAGTYADVQRYPSQAAGHPGLTWRGMGRSCSLLSGSFTVTSVTWDYFSMPERISTTVEQHCNGGAPALHGQLDYDFGGMGPVAIEPDSLLVSSGFMIHGYDAEGAERRDYPILGNPGDFSHPTDQYDFFRDLTVGPTGIVYGISGTFSPSLRIWDPGSGLWSDAAKADWQASNSSDPVGLAAMDAFVFVIDTSGNTEQSLLRYDTANDSWLRFGSTQFYKDIAAGWDGDLYALRFSDGTTVDRYNPLTLQPIGSVALETPVDAIAAAADGRIYGLSGAPSVLYRFSSAGAIEASDDEAFVLAFDLDLSSDGRIAIGLQRAGGGWGVTTTALEPVTFFPAPEGDSHPTYVAFAEPGYRSNRIFIDGFETGGSSLWSAASP